MKLKTWLKRPVRFQFQTSMSVKHFKTLKNSIFYQLRAVTIFFLEGRDYLRSHIENVGGRRVNLPIHTDTHTTLDIQWEGNTEPSLGSSQG